MMGFKYRIDDQEALYFVTFTVVDWIDVFIREHYCEIFLESVRFCQREKGLIVGAWIIMTSHVHMIISTDGTNPLAHIIRDLKSYTSRKVRLAIEHSATESRKEWMMSRFKRAGYTNSNNNDYQLWIQDNHPIQLSSGDMLLQRLEYLHNNPVVAGFITRPEEWKYSSATDYAGGTQGLLQLAMLV